MVTKLGNANESGKGPKPEKIVRQFPEHPRAIDVIEIPQYSCFKPEAAIIKEKRE